MVDRSDHVVGLTPTTERMAHGSVYVTVHSDKGALAIGVGSGYVRFPL
jgi:hypothetical protein